MKNVPNLRFKEFSGEWEYKLLSSFATKITQKNGDYKVTNVISNSAKNGLVSQKDYFDKDIANQENINGYYVINNGDFVYNPRKSNESPYGPINRFSSTEAGVVSPLYLCFSVNCEVNDRYLEYYFKSSKWYQFIYKNSDQGARHDRVSIRDAEFFKMKLNIPNYQEQEKIASFFSLIDKKIELQTEKVEELKNYKKGIMQKIFSQELRFKDENGNEYPEWKLGRLGEYLINKGGTPLEKYVEDEGTYNFISIGNYSVDGNYIDTGQRINLNDKTHEKLLNKNDLVMVLNDKTASGDLIGSTILIDEDNKYIYNQRSERLICNSAISPDFCWILLNSKMFRRKVFSIAQGGTQIYVNFSSVKNLEIELPHLKEQEKIVHFIFNLNTKLNKEQEKLDGLNQYKKGLLQQMFI